MDKYLQLEKIRTIIQKAKRPVVFFDTDSDGTMSYFQLKTLNSNLKGFPFKKTREEQIELVQTIDSNCDVVIFIDISYIYEAVFEEISISTIVWVDHHISEQKELIDEKNIEYFNPLIYDSHDTRPASYWAYKIANKKENLPYVCLGTLADFYLLVCIKELYYYMPETFAILFNISEDKTNHLIEFISKYNYYNYHTQRAEWIRYLSYNSNIGKLKLFFDYIYKKDFSNIDEIVSYLQKLSLEEIIAEISAQQQTPFDQYGEFLKEVSKHLKKVLKKNENSLVAFYYYQGDVSYTRQIAEEALYRLEGAEIVFIAFKKDNSDIVSCSFRSKHIPIQSLITETLNSFNGRGGGHELACGAIVDKSQFESFKQLILEEFNALFTHHY